MLHAQPDPTLVAGFRALLESRKHGAGVYVDPDRPRICLRVRQAVALPIYAVALILSYSSDALGKPAA